MSSAPEAAYRPAAESHETESHSSLHIYLPGIMGTDQGMKAIYDEVAQAVQEHYPGAQFEARNSYISPDTLKLPDRDRHILLARKVVQALSDRQDIHLYGHSLGAVELARVMFLVRKMRPDLKGDHPDLQKLHLVLMSPGGFGKNLRQLAQGVYRMKDILLAGSEKSGHIFGLETVAYLPLKAPGAKKDDAVFLSAPEQAGLITRFFHDESQRGKAGGSPVANEIDGVYQTHNPDTLQARFARLTDEEKQKLYEYDDLIWIAAQRGDQATVRQLFTKRGRILGKYVQETYSGLPIEETETPEQQEETEKATWRLYAQAMLGSARLITGLLTGSSYRELKPLYDAGVDVSFLVPEYDALVKMNEIVDFLGEDEAKERALLLKTTTHSSSSVAPGMLAEAFKKIARR
ncbi:hypothetical protein H3C70_02480 [Patescibacteria group bacterium]|nr:hypothetical protein [Patescibacteria group bacterium]